jgi:hypothetical protein
VRSVFKEGRLLTLLTGFILLPITNAHPEGRNGVEHSEALRRVVRAGSRGTIGPLWLPETPSVQPTQREADTPVRNIPHLRLLHIM